MGGVCPIACWDTRPETRGRHPPWTRGRHPPRDQTPPRTRQPPGPETPQDQTSLGPDLPGTRNPSVQTHTAGRYGQQAGSMHPTGIHTCFTGVCTSMGDGSGYITPLDIRLWDLSPPPPPRYDTWRPYTSHWTSDLPPSHQY